MIQSGDARHFRAWLGGWFGRPRLDPWLLFALLSLGALGLVVLYSASGGDTDMVGKQALRLVVGFAAMWAVSRLNSAELMRITPWFFMIALLLLLLVPLFGDGRSANSWLNAGLFRFQPSELMKLALPMAVAWYLHARPLPPRWIDIGVAGLIIGVPTGLIVIQPDLGTGMLVGAAGAFTVFLAGMSYLRIALFVGLGAAAIPLAWPLLHEYQQKRVLTLFDPESDPLGSGWHIIQSKIAVGSGGLSGKGYTHGTQSQLEFLPERQTDFIFAVLSEEGGFVMVALAMLLYAVILLRALYLAANAKDCYARLLGGSVALTFFVYVFVNGGMVSGMLPVVGVPMPLLSYGGSSAVSLLASFGVLMGIAAQRRR